jgi:hypothetical protein
VCMGTIMNSRSAGLGPFTCEIAWKLCAKPEEPLPLIFAI